MSINTLLATIQMRRGAEENFDPDQMTAGEWAVSMDTKKVWMCFRPGLVLRMATYEAFEKDMEEIRQILVEAQDIQSAIEAWNYLAESYAHGGTGKREGEDNDNAKYYSEQAKASAESASALADIGIMTTEKAGIGKPDGTTITADADGTMHVISGGSGTETDVTGVKGDKESEYRTGNVNLTPENIGAIPVEDKDNFASKSIYGDELISLGRKSGISTGRKSISYGTNNAAMGANSDSFGNNNVSVDSHSFSEGCGNIALGYGSHAENCQNIAGAKYVFKIASYDATAKKFTFDNTFDGFSDSFSTLEVGSKLHIANTNYINDASIYTVSSIGSDGKSVVVNENIPTSNFNVFYATLIKSGGNYGGCHSEGRQNVSLNTYAHSEGYKTEAKGYSSHTEGLGTKTTSAQSHAEGYLTEATGIRSHSEGEQTVASGSASHSEGYKTQARGNYSHSSGYYTIANGNDQTVIGRCNVESAGGANGDYFIIGSGGSYDSRANAFRVNNAGSVYAKGNYNTSGADYAEFIREWYDGNPNSEDRVGYFVTVKDGYLHKANEGDYIVGITSGNPSIVGNSDEEYYWRWERDDFNRIIYEELPETTEKIDDSGEPVIDEETGKPVMIETGNMRKVAKQSEDYDPSKQSTYIERKDRKEWDYVGMLGVLPVRDDGTCEVGRFCRCADGGIATIAETRGFDTYMVIERISENIVSVILK